MESQFRFGQRSKTYMNCVLTVIACLLALVLAQGVVGLPSPAMAQASRERITPDPARGIVNPADQRAEIIAELRKLTSKMETLGARLGASGPIEVRVVEMPDGEKGD